MNKKIVFIGNSIVNGFPYSRGKSFPGLIRAAVKEGRSLRVDDDDRRRVDDINEPHAGIGGSHRVDGEVDKTAKANNTEKVPTFSADVINKGENGQLTSDIAIRFEHDVIDHQPAVVFIMTGTNDFIFGDATPNVAFDNLEEIAIRAVEANIVPVYMTPLRVDAKQASSMWMAGLGIDYDSVNDYVEELSEMIRSSGRLYVDTNIAYQQYASDTTIGSALCTTQTAGVSFSTTADGRSSTVTGADGFKSQIEKSSGAYRDGVHPTAEGYSYLAGIVLGWIEDNKSELGLA